MKSNILWIVILGIVLFASYYYINMNQSSDLTSKPGAPTASTSGSTTTGMTPVTVPLKEQGDSGQSGTAVFTENTEGNLVVTVTLTGGTYTAPQPVHIHLGGCPGLGSIKYDLANAVGGKSETVVDTNWSSLMASGEKYAVNIHKSGAEPRVYTACGDLPTTK